MKRYGNLLPKIVDYKNLWEASKRASRGNKNKRTVAAFNYRLPENLIELQRELSNGTYRCSDYFLFEIFDPKRRWIVVSDFRDRVVHHALCNVIVPTMERKFIFDSYANRIGKGTHRAVRRYRQFARQFKYVLNCDIVKFFPSIDREMMKSIIRRTIKCRKTWRLCDTIIDSAPVGDNLSYCPDGCRSDRRTGLPIGNLTSQHFCNVYLNDFDHFVKETLRCKGYLRYVDDFALFSESKRELAEWKSAIEEYLRSLYLVLHEGKTQIRPCRLGNTFLGYRVFPHTIRLDGKKGRLWIKRIKYKRRLYQAGELDWQEVKASIVSWIAHTKHADSDALIRKVLWNLVF